MKQIIQTMAMCVVVILSAKLGRVSFPDGRTETYYDLPMHKIVQQATEKNIPGEFWIRENGAKMYGDFARKEPYTIDIATDWKKGDNI